jgi:hypothetical protein
MLLSTLLRHGTGQGKEVAWGQMYYSLVLILGVLVVATAIRLNWRGDAAGYWINLGIALTTDGVFVFIMMAPGYITFSQGISGPIFAVPAIVLTTIAHISGRGQFPRRVSAVARSASFPADSSDAVSGTS